MSDLPRDPEHYWPTEHATVRKKERGFEWPDIADVIEHGEIYSGFHEDEPIVFHTEDYSVPVNPNDGAIITVCTVSLGEYIENLSDDDPIANYE